MENYIQGPTMLAATAVLKSGPARISRIGPGIKLPRTVPIRTLIAVAVGGILFLIPTLTIVGLQLRSVFIAAVIGGAAGWTFVTYSPMKGETMMRWIGLEALAMKNRRLEVQGEKVQAYIGICPVAQLARGKVRIVAGHANVPPGSVDDRGGVIPVHERDAGLLVRLGRRDDETENW